MLVVPNDIRCNLLLPLLVDNFLTACTHIPPVRVTFIFGGDGGGKGEDRL
jgi:hypothetical protein